jgi:hypothetical protein
MGCELSLGSGSGGRAWTHALFLKVKTPGGLDLLGNHSGQQREKSPAAPSPLPPVDLEAWDTGVRQEMAQEPTATQLCVGGSGRRAACPKSWAYSPCSGEPKKKKKKFKDGTSIGQGPCLTGLPSSCLQSSLSSSSDPVPCSPTCHASVHPGHPVPNIIHTLLVLLVPVTYRDNRVT